MNYKLILALLGANSLAVRLEMMQQAEAVAEPIAVPISIELIEDDIVGGPTTITCDDGSEVMCPAGTRDCFDGSAFYCDTPELIAPEEEIILGGPTIITCDDGTEVMCPAGTRDCFDGSETYCGGPEPEIILGGQ